MNTTNMKRILLCLLIGISYLFANAQGVVVYKKDGTTIKVPYAQLDSISTYISDEESISIVGTWKYSFDSGYVLLTFSGNATSGTVTYTEYDNGRTDTYSSSYSFTNNGDGSGHLYMPDFAKKSWQSVVVVSFTKDRLILKDLPDGGENSFVRQNGADITVSIVGTWKYSFDSGYVLLTFSGNATSGTVKYTEYDNGRTDVYTSSYSFISNGDGSGHLYMPDFAKKTWQSVEVVSLTKDRLILKDLPDSGNCTFIIQ